MQGILFLGSYKHLLQFQCYNSLDVFSTDVSEDT